MRQAISGYHQNSEEHWVAELSCGHFQNVRHDPPLSTRKWTQTQQGRDLMMGFELNCEKCDDGAPRDSA
ncbi:MAG: DUF3565 domain-containing protein [Mariniblastus sp.]|nr:DUF3565 domain-containing protein [Mariniblastus sp.]